MKLDFTEINGREIKISEMEYLYSYTKEDGKKIAVFEFQGDRVEKEIIKNN
jgi:hypothetical protein